MESNLSIFLLLENEGAVRESHTISDPVSYGNNISYFTRPVYRETNELVYRLEYQRHCSLRIGYIFYWKDKMTGFFGKTRKPLGVFPGVFNQRTLLICLARPHLCCMILSGSFVPRDTRSLSTCKVHRRIAFSHRPFSHGLVNKSVRN